MSNQYGYNHQHEENTQHRHPVSGIFLNCIGSRLNAYAKRFSFDLEWSGHFNGRSQCTFQISGLSPRERTGAASPILEVKGFVIRGVFAFDAQFWGGGSFAIASDLNGFLHLSLQGLAEVALSPSVSGREG